MSPITFADSVQPGDKDSSESSEEETGKGYEQDNEDESDGDDTGSERGRPHNAARILPQVDQATSNDLHALHAAAAAVTAHSKRTGGSGPYNPDRLMVIRFSTGQLLDDDMALESYCIRPYELLEIHRYGSFLRLPRRDISLYVEPYWEGNAQALRQVVSSRRTKDKDGSKPTRRQGPPSTLQWRARWVLIHEGVLTLRKGPDVSTILLLY